MAFKLAKVGDVIFMNPAKTEIYLRHVAGKASPNDFKFSRKGDKLGTVTAVVPATFQTSSGPQTINVYRFKRDFYDAPLYVLAGEAVHGADVQQKWLFENIARIDLDTRNRLNDLGDIFAQAQAKGLPIPQTYVNKALALADSMNVRQEKLALEGYVKPEQVSGIGVLPALTLLPRLAAFGVRLWPWIVRGATVLGTAAFAATAIEYVWNKWGKTYDQAALDRFQATDVVKKARAALTPQEQQQFDQATETLSQDQYQQGQNNAGFAAMFGKGMGQIIGLGALALGAFFLFGKGK